MNDRFLELMLQSPLPADELRRTLTECAKGGVKAEDFEAAITQVQEALIQAADFDGMVAFHLGLAQDLALDAAFGASAKLLLKKTVKDRLVLAALDSAGFEDQPPVEAFRRFNFLRGLEAGTIVMDKTWGVGVVKSVDAFFKRVNIDFPARKNHPVPMAQAAASLSRVGAAHLLAQKIASPAALAARVKEAPADVIREALRDFGAMSVARLEETLVENGILAASGWKNFWEAARKVLKADPCVEIPARRTDPIVIREQAQDVSGAWLKAFSAERDIAKILAKIEDARARQPDLLKRGDALAALAERMAFAEKGGFKSDPVLYARIALTCRELGLATPAPEVFRAHLWDADRHLAAAAGLSARDTEALAKFMLDDENGAARVLDALDRLPYAFLEPALALLRANPDAPARCAALLLSPKAPPAIILWALRNRAAFKEWRLAGLHDLITHGLALLDEKFMKEELRLQNNIKALFENMRWFEAAFAELDPLQRQSVFERFQNAAAWRNEPSTHHRLITAMIKAEPGLANLRKAKTAAHEGEKAAPRLTSWRSLAEKKKAYSQLVDVEMPKNTQDIATARGYGDLRENFEYQSAKDLQRQLLHRQSVMENELRLVKGSDFADAPLDHAGPGVGVALAGENGARKNYVILGEWDRDEALNIISCRSRLAQCLEGHVAGDQLMVPAEDGEQLVTLAAITPLTEEVRAWIGEPWANHPQGM
ncbi:MAG: GreA/GreB family elongation factor [Kiritimatiellaeota bacterium]|nr:GreA/GreB family elongation factor [Kiritimatiellota bacterium]